MAKRILSLLGGGAKGIFTLGVLEGIEAKVGAPLSDKFDLMVGTSTGAIIASMLALGKSVADITRLYQQHIPHILRPFWKRERGTRLKEMAMEVFGGTRFHECKTRLAVVTTNLSHGRPTVFKSYADGAYSGAELFQPGYGQTVGDAVRASCAAYPFFPPVVLELRGASHELIDGGFAANDPSLFALLDALGPLGWPQHDLRLVTIGTGKFAEARGGVKGIIAQWLGLRVFASTLETGSSSQEFLVSQLYPRLARCRIPSSAGDAAIHTSLLETRRVQLDKILECGRAAYRESEPSLAQLLT